VEIRFDEHLCPARHPILRNHAEECPLHIQLREMPSLGEFPRHAPRRSAMTGVTFEMFLDAPAGTIMPAANYALRILSHELLLLQLHWDLHSTQHVGHLQRNRDKNVPLKWMQTFKPDPVGRRLFPAYPSLG